MNQLFSPQVIRPMGIFCLLGVFIFGLNSPLANPVAADDGQRQWVESDDGRVQQVGTWLFQSATQASGGGYLYHMGVDEAVLELDFIGPSLEIGYISGPTLGVMAIEVDGVVLRTVFTTDNQTHYQQKAVINYLTDEPHHLRVYAQSGGVIAVDGFGAETIGAMVAATERSTATTRNCLPDYTIRLVSRGTDGTPFSNPVKPVISGDGRYVAMVVANNTLLSIPSDIVLIDRQTCQVIAIPRPEIPSNAYSITLANIAISPDGRYLACLYVYMISYSMPHIPGPWYLMNENYLYEIDAGAITNILGYGYTSYDPNLDFYTILYTTQGLAFSSDSHYLIATPAPSSALSQLVPTVSLFNLNTMAWSILELEPFAIHFRETIALSNNADFIGFLGRSTSNVAQVYVYNQPLDQVELITHTPIGDPSSSDAQNVKISADGRYVAFQSSANDLVAGTPSGTKIYIYDRQTDEFEYIASDYATLLDLSANGRYVLYTAADTLPNDSNGFSDVVFYDRQTQTHKLLSVTFDGLQSNNNSARGNLSADARLAVFTSAATNLDPSISSGGVYTAPTGVYLPLAGDGLTLFRPDLNAASLIQSLQDVPPPAAYNSFTTNAPVSGQWVMGDWDGDGHDTFGVYGDNGVFYYANSNTASPTWSAIWIGLLGRPPVVGHFNSAVNHDCIGAVDNAEFPPYGTAFALYFTCDLTNGTAPALTFQWLSVLLPTNQGFSGTHQFAAGDFNNDGVESIAVRRGPYIAFTNVPPTTLLSLFDMAQYWGVPPVTGNDEGLFVAGDFDNAAGASFGVVYQNGHFYYRNAVDWNPAGYNLQRVGQPIGAPFTVSTWH